MAALLSEVKRDTLVDFERAWAVRRPSPPLATHHVTQKSTLPRKASLALGLAATRNSHAQIT